MQRNSRSRTAWALALVASTLLTAALPAAVQAGDCDRSSPAARAKSSSDLKLEAFLLKHRPYLVVQQPSRQRDARP